MTAPRPFRSALLLFALLSALPAAGQKLSGPPREAAPGPPPATAAPSEPHPAAAGNAAGTQAPVAVDFAAAAQRTAIAGPPPGLRFHLQGEPPADEGQEPTDAVPPAPGASGDGGHPPPTGGATAGDLAAGDPVATFNALSFTGWIPPDTVLAVGPASIVEAVNSGFAVFTKAGGTQQGYTDFEIFFDPLLPVGWGGSIFDPRVSYSPEHGRFVLLALAVDRVLQESYLLLAFSQTSDPTGSWWLYRYSADAANPADADSWMDYCGLGADTWGVYVTCNLFRWTGTFKYAQLWSLGTDHFTGGPGGGWVFWDLRWNSNAAAFSLQPATPYSVAGDEATFFVNTFSSSGNAVLLWKLTGDRTNSPALARATIGTSGYEAIGNNVDQPGSSSDIDGGDARIMNAAYSFRRVYAVLTDDVDNNGRRAGWLLFQLDVDANSLPWQTLIATATTAASGGFYYFYPAVTLDGFGGTSPNVAIFGSWTDSETTLTASTNFASGVVKIFTDPPATAGPFLGIVNGAGAYALHDSSGRNRWGDYSGAAFDWTTGAVWGAVEIAGSGNSWRTVITGRTASDGCGPDGFEPDDGSAQASTISSGIPQVHSLCPAGDFDWVRLDLAATSGIELTTGGPAGDTELWLHDGGGSEIDYDDDGGADLFSRIVRTCGVDALPAGTYFARVGELGADAELPLYSLGFAATPCCVTNLALSGSTLTGAQTYRATSTATLGPNLVVSGTAIRVVAGSRVVLRAGTSIGGSFSATVSPSPCTASP